MLLPKVSYGNDLIKMEKVCMSHIFHQGISDDIDWFKNRDIDRLDAKYMK